MFDNLADKFLGLFENLRNHKSVTQKNIDEVFAQIRTILIDSDVALNSIEHFLQQVQAHILGETIIKGVSSSEMIIKLINDELIKFLGSTVAELQLNKIPTVIMMVGLQGSGKTTSSAKLAYYLRQKLQKKTLLVSLDTYRPAAREQLEILAQQNNLHSLPIDLQENNPLSIAKQALKQAKKEYYDIIIFDTAGRLQIDDKLMEELQKIAEITEPVEKLLVCDSLMGQDAIKVAKNFHETINLTGIILTRLDSDAKGGAAISLRDATNCPIKFIGEGEKIADFATFDPTRMASRILGMGDIVSLVEKAQEVVTESEAKKLQQKIRTGTFDLNDFLKQLDNLKKMGGMSTLLNLIPGMSSMKEKLNSMIDEDEIKRQKAMILSMTIGERNNPDDLSSSRKRRITQGSGTNIQELNHLLKKFKDAKRVASKLGPQIDFANNQPPASSNNQITNANSLPSSSNLSEMLQQFQKNWK